MTENQDVETEEFCYICFEGATRTPEGELEPLVQVCRCPTRVHRRCVARWQLYSAGKREEKSCRFCQDTLPDWKEVLTPRALPPAVPVLSIYYNNTCCRMKVRPGPDGLQAFLRQLEVIVGRDVANVNFVFRCRCPDTGAEIFLQGLQAFEAAMHCACVRAAQRSLLQQRQQLQVQYELRHHQQDPLRQRQLLLGAGAQYTAMGQQQQSQPRRASAPAEHRADGASGRSSFHQVETSGPTEPCIASESSQQQQQQQSARLPSTAGGGSANGSTPGLHSCSAAPGSRACIEPMHRMSGLAGLAPMEQHLPRVVPLPSHSSLVHRGHSHSGPIIVPASAGIASGTASTIASPGAARITTALAAAARSLHQHDVDGGAVDSGSVAMSSMADAAGALQSGGTACVSPVSSAEVARRTFTPTTSERHQGALCAIAGGAETCAVAGLIQGAGHQQQQQQLRLSGSSVVGSSSPAAMIVAVRPSTPSVEPRSAAEGASSRGSAVRCGKEGGSRGSKLMSSIKGLRTLFTKRFGRSSASP